jgi:hypothetical protein
VSLGKFIFMGEKRRDSNGGSCIPFHGTLLAFIAVFIYTCSNSQFSISVFIEGEPPLNEQFSLNKVI